MTRRATRRPPIRAGASRRASWGPRRSSPAVRRVPRGPSTRIPTAAPGSTSGGSLSGSSSRFPHGKRVDDNGKGRDRDEPEGLQEPAPQDEREDRHEGADRRLGERRGGGGV